jgi:Tfp pilus assembly protein PilN
MRAVNLLPADAYAPKQRLPHAPVVLAATAPVFAGALIYLGYSLEHSKVSDRKLQLEAVQSQIVALSPTQAALAQLSQITDARTKHQIELADALSKEEPWDVAFDQIGRVLPKNAWLTSVSALSPTPVSATSSASTPTCSIQGYTYSQADVARVLERLSLVPALTNVTLGASAVSQIGKRNVVQFTITASLAVVSAQ